MSLPSSLVPASGDVGRHSGQAGVREQEQHKGPQRSRNKETRGEKCTDPGRALAFVGIAGVLKA